MYLKTLKNQTGSRMGVPRARRLATLIAAGGLLCVLAGCSAADDATSAAAGPSPAASTGALASSALKLVVIGDSIPYNSPQDCPGCTGFVERYAQALKEATGRAVAVTNLSEHTGLTLPRLMSQLASLEAPLSQADAIIVAIAHNSIVLNEDAPCGTPFDEATSTLKDWRRVTQECATESARGYQDQFDELYSRIASWREGHPTLLITLNKYNDWIGWPDANLTADQERRTTMVHDTWNEMICAAAERHGFACADVSAAFNGPKGDKPAGDLLAADYTHPSDRGNALITTVLANLGFEPLG